MNQQASTTKNFQLFTFFNELIASGHITSFCNLRTIDNFKIFLFDDLALKITVLSKNTFMCMANKTSPNEFKKDHYYFIAQNTQAFLKSLETVYRDIVFKEINRGWGVEIKYRMWGRAIFVQPKS